MSLIVQKFGGSSVKDAAHIKNVAGIIADTYLQGNDVMVVLSAQGDTTDDLIEKAHEINPNPSKRETVSVWAICTSPAMYFNLIVHELHHLSVHIASANKLDLEGEDVCYINGDTAQHLWDLCHPLICPQR